MTIDMMDCGEISCEYCSKDKCIYMTDSEVENKAESEGEKEMTYIEALTICTLIISAIGAVMFIVCTKLDERKGE